MAKLKKIGKPQNAKYALGLQAQLDINPNARLQAILDDTNTRRKNRRLARMEAHSRAHNGITSDEDVDWMPTNKKIDWAGIIQLILKILPLILALFP